LRYRDIYALHFNRHSENKLSGKALLQVASTGSATGAAAELGSLGNLGSGGGNDSIVVQENWTEVEE